MKKKIFDGIEYVVDFGKITYVDFDKKAFPGNYLRFCAEGEEYIVAMKHSAIILCGRFFIVNKEHTDTIPCCDPRIICMILWNLQRYCHELPAETPPIPTMKEARKWLRDADIPLEPREPSSDDDYSPKTMEFIFNNNW